MRTRTLPHKKYTRRNIQHIFETQLNPGMDPQNPTAWDRLRHAFIKPRYTNSRWGLIIQALETETGLTHFLVADMDRHGNTHPAYVPAFYNKTTHQQQTDPSTTIPKRSPFKPIERSYSLRPNERLNRSTINKIVISHTVPASRDEAHPLTAFRTKDDTLNLGFLKRSWPPSRLFPSHSTFH